MHQRASRDTVNVMKQSLHLLKTCCVSLEIRQVMSLPLEAGTVSTKSFKVMKIRSTDKIPLMELTDVLYLAKLNLFISKS